MSLMSLEVDAVSPSHATVFIFIFKNKINDSPAVLAWWCRRPVMSLMSFEVEGVSPSHVTVFIFIFERKLSTSPKRGGVGVGEYKAA